MNLTVLYDNKQLIIFDMDNTSNPFLIAESDICKISGRTNEASFLKMNGDVLRYKHGIFSKKHGNKPCKHNNPIKLYNDPTIRDIACGEGHCLVIKRDDNSGKDEIFVSGLNQMGQLGLGDYDNRKDLTFLLTDSNIKQICCGFYNSLILKSSGELLVFGEDQFGQIGLGNDNDYVYVNIPTILYIPKEIKEIICGGFHTMILLMTNELYVFGENHSGQLGLGDNQKRFTPVLLIIDHEIKQISCGRWHSMILKLNGELLVFGSNRSGQLGLDDHTSKNIPTFLMKDRGIRQIVCGDVHSIIYKYNGDIFFFDSGNNIKYGKNKSTHLITNEELIMINEKKISKIDWKSEIYCFLSDKTKTMIMTFIYVCKRIEKMMGIKIYKVIRNEIIKHLFN